MLEEMLQHTGYCTLGKQLPQKAEELAEVLSLALAVGEVT